MFASHSYSSFSYSSRVRHTFAKPTSSSKTKTPPTYPNPIPLSPPTQSSTPAGPKTQPREEKRDRLARIGGLAENSLSSGAVACATLSGRDPSSNSSGERATRENRRGIASPRLEKSPGARHRARKVPGINAVNSGDEPALGRIRPNCSEAGLQLAELPSARRCAIRRRRPGDTAPRRMHN